MFYRLISTLIMNDMTMVVIDIHDILVEGSMSLVSQDISIYNVVF